MENKETQLLFEIYKLHANFAETIDTSREGLNKIYSGMVASIVVASVLLHRYLPENETVWVLPMVGIVVSISWWFSLSSLTRKLRVKNQVLLDLEELLPFRFFEREDQKFQKSNKLRRKHTLYILPLTFGIVCAVWLACLIQLPQNIP